MSPLLNVSGGAALKRSDGYQRRETQKLKQMRPKTIYCYNPWDPLAAEIQTNRTRQQKLLRLLFDA